MRVLALLLVLLGMPALALAATPGPGGPPPAAETLLAQQQTQPPVQSPTQLDPPPPAPRRHPGDYCCRHCRHNETPCGDKCLAGGSNRLCGAKQTCACPGKP